MKQNSGVVQLGEARRIGIEEASSWSGSVLGVQGMQRVKRYCSSPPGASNLVGNTNIQRPYVMPGIIVECQEQNKIKVQFCLAGQGCSK